MMLTVCHVFDLFLSFPYPWHFFCCDKSYKKVEIKEDTIMAFIDYYKVMGVPKDIPQDDIKAAYRRRSKQFHPDLHPDDPKAKAKFQMLNEAYAVLSDPEKRAKYDKYGEQWKNAEAFENASGGFIPFGGGTEGWTDGGFSFNFGGGGGFSDFFERLFGNRRGGAGTRASYGSAVNHNEGQAQSTVTIDMYTALLGGEIMLQTADTRLRLKVKPGTQNGTKVRLKGKGYQRADGSFGDLIITYNVALPTNLSERQKQLLMEMRNA